MIRAGKRDTVASIARRYKLSASQVADWNDVGASAAFKPGQRVVLYLPVRAAARVPGRMVHKASTAKSRKGKAAPQRRAAKSKRAR